MSRKGRRFSEKDMRKRRSLECILVILTGMRARYRRIEDWLWPLQ